MVGVGHVLIAFLSIGLPCWGYLIAHKNGGHGLAGIGLGFAVFVAIVSGDFVRLMILDFRDRKRYPARAGVGVKVATAAVVIFAFAVAASVVLYQQIMAG